MRSEAVVTIHAGPVVDMVSRDVGKRIAHHAGALRWHGVDCEQHGDRLMALCVVLGPNGEDRSTWVDVTNFSVGALYRWLGY